MHVVAEHLIDSIKNVGHRQSKTAGLVERRLRRFEKITAGLIYAVSRVAGGR